ncbi:MAG: ComEC/Rec2 family competence protein [Planctomycetaceae bacterium]|nr:ComEC/Rec2 family competence protein [Planctomycetaceae bacterium]
MYHSFGRKYPHFLSLLSFALFAKHSFSAVPLSSVFAAAVLGIIADRFLIGNLLSFALPFWILTMLLSLAGFILFNRFNRRKTHSTAALFILSTVFAVFGLHHYLHWYRSASDEIGFLVANAAFPAVLQGTVIETLRILPPPKPDPGRVFDVQERTLFTLQAEKLRNNGGWLSVSGKVAVSIDGSKTGLHIGDKVNIIGKLSKPMPPQNKGDFDYAAMLRTYRIISTVRVACPDAVVLVPPESKTFTRFFTTDYWYIGTLRFFETIRLAARNNLKKVMSPEALPFAEAMLLGFRENVDEDTVVSLIETGTMHILSISGLHIALVALTLALLLNIFGVHRKVIAGILIGIVLIYFFLTDVRPPALRATVLVCVVSASVLSGRRAVGINSLSASALFVLFINPAELFQFGTQLSFIATGTFLWTPSPESFRRFIAGKTNLGKNRYKDRDTDADAETIIYRCISSFAVLVIVSTIVWLISVPLILAQIHVFTPVSIVVNPLLGLPMTAALLSGFAAAFFGSVPILGYISGLCADYSFLLLFNGIEFFQQLGGHYYMYAPPVWWNIVFYILFCAFTFLPLKRPKMKTIAAVLLLWSAVGITAGYIRDFNRWYNDRLTVTVCSVGHGGGTIITMPNKKTVIYDAGCFSSPKRAADVLSVALWRQGKMKIDAVIISHHDKDHCNGLAKIAERFHIGRIYVSPKMFSQMFLHCNDAALNELRQTLQKYKIPVITLMENDGLGLQGAHIFYPPRSGITDDSVNASSIVLRLEHRGTGILLPGDLDSRTTPEFLQRGPKHSAVMLAPHHGGSSRQLTALLNWAAPKILIVSDGAFTRRNPLLGSYCEDNRVLLRSTFESGGIEIHVDKNGVKVLPP